jgi:cytidylate kinase
MIRVKVPLDLNAIARSGSAAFALATPLRVRDLLVLVVREAIGGRAPDDKLRRTIHRTLRGFARGDFSVWVDGRPMRDADTVVVCAGTADVRFFLTAVRV